MLYDVRPSSEKLLAISIHDIHNLHTLVYILLQEITLPMIYTLLNSIQFGCTTVISIPADDPDADSVRCRLASPGECGDACTSAPNITLSWVVQS